MKLFESEVPRFIAAFVAGLTVVGAASSAGHLDGQTWMAAITAVVMTFINWKKHVTTGTLQK